MRAARYHGPGVLTVEDMAPPAIGEGEILVRMHACGICGTDIKTYLRGHRLIQPGSVLGHEIAGVVVESRHAGFVAGQRVAVGPYAPCGTCDRCRRGHFSLCADLGAEYADPGGFSELIRVPRRLADQVAIVLPDHLDDETATLGEPVACSIHGLKAAGLSAGTSILIIGDGPMGLLQAALARAWGARAVVLAGMVPERLAFARRVADVVVDVSSDDLAEVVRAHLPEGPELVMASVASLQVVEQAVQLAAKGGTVNVFAGMPRDQTLRLDLGRVHYDEIRIVGSFGFGPADFRQAIDSLASGDLDLAGFVTRRVPIDDLEGAIQAAGRYEGIKTVVVAVPAS